MITEITDATPIESGILRPNIGSPTSTDQEFKMTTMRTTEGIIQTIVGLMIVTMAHESTVACAIRSNGHPS